MTPSMTMRGARAALATLLLAGTTAGAWAHAAAGAASAATPASASASAASASASASTAHASHAAARVVLPDDVTPATYRIAIVPHAQDARFEGRVEIDLQVRRPTRRIVLNAAELVIDSAALAGEPETPTIQLDASRETATFTFAHPVTAGAHTLALAYHGKIFDQANALFRLRYATAQGEATALYTQFEDADARRFVPCWDEPARKAVFELTATVPAGQMALGNMPIAATEALPDGLKRVRFAATPRMSSYLLFFGLGDFERVHREVEGVDVGVVVKRGDSASAAYALETAAAILPYFNDYFGVRYPLPKLDMIAGAGSSLSFGAMENWGAIFYFDYDLLIDDRISTDADRQRVTTTVAHEMAHQWFGDLVTMDWWDDLWLNEGFASWMQTKATEHLHPEWNAWLGTGLIKQAAMAVDARAGTHPVIMQIADITHAGDAFDIITYDKGAQVIRTLESMLGEEAFRAGVRRYMRRHAYGNTVTDDFWRAMDDGAPRPVTAIAHDLTLQPGVPTLVEADATCRAGRTRVTLSQGQFALDRDPAAPRRWRVPTTVAVLGGGRVQALVSGSAAQSVTVDGCGPVILNAGQAGYFRSRYSAAGLAALTQAFARLEPLDQLALLNDTSSFALQGQLDMGALLALMRQVPVAADPLVARALVDQLVDLDRLHDGLPAQPAFRAFARSLLAPMLAQLGWDAAPAQGGNEGRLRAALIEALGRLDDAQVRAEAERRFDRYLEQPASLDAALHHAVLAVVAGQADPARWDRLHVLAQQARTHREREAFYELLGTARDEALAQRALDLSLSGEPPATTAAGLLRAVAFDHPELALRFLRAHWDSLQPVLGEDAGAVVLARFFNLGASPQLDAALTEFAAQHVSGGGGRLLDKTRAVVRYRTGLRAQRVPAIDAWIAAQRPLATVAGD